MAELRLNTFPWMRNDDEVCRKSRLHIINSAASVGHHLLVRRVALVFTHPDAAVSELSRTSQSYNPQSSRTRKKASDHDAAANRQCS